jgi:hypothetical protein
MSQQEALNRHRTIAALYQSKTAGMDSSDTPKAGNGPRPIPPLVVSIELLANLIYLSRRTETHSAQQHYYLDWATSVIEELSHHPNLHECAENRRQGCLGNDLTRHRDARFPNQRGAKRLSSGPPEELKDRPSHLGMRKPVRTAVRPTQAARLRATDHPRSAALASKSGSLLAR